VIACRISEQERGSCTDIIDADKARAGALISPVEQASKSGMPEAARVANGPGDMA